MVAFFPIGLALAVLGGCFAFYWFRTDDFDSIWSVWNAAMLLALAWQMDSVWLAIFFAWVALLPVWVILGLRAGLLPTAVHPPAMLIRQMAIATAGIGYLFLRAQWKPAFLPAFAAAWVILCAANAIYAEVQRAGRGLPPHHQPRPGAQVGGLFSSGHCAAWAHGLAALCAAYLIARGSWWPTLAAPLAAFGWWRTRNWAAALAILAAALVLVVFSAPAFGLILLGVLAGQAILGSSIKGSFVQAIYHGRGWVTRHRILAVAWQMIRRSKGWGYGLGFWAECRVLRVPQDDQDTSWAESWPTLHNEWVQSVVELGPVPALCGIGTLVTSLVHTVNTPESVFTTALLLYMAVYAALYDPLHTPGQALVVLLALGARP